MTAGTNHRMETIKEYAPPKKARLRSNSTARQYEPVKHQLTTGDQKPKKAHGAKGRSASKALGRSGSVGTRMKSSEQYLTKVTEQTLDENLIEIESKI